MRTFALISLALLLIGCQGTSQGTSPVNINYDLDTDTTSQAPGLPAGLHTYQGKESTGSYFTLLAEFTGNKAWYSSDYWKSDGYSLTIDGNQVKGRVYEKLYFKNSFHDYNVRLNGTFSNDYRSVNGTVGIHSFKGRNTCKYCDWGQ